MARAMLIDESPHAQRMGESLLRAEGCEVVTVSDGLTAMVRLYDADPDIVLCKISAARRDGFDVCEFVRLHPRHRHARVILTAGAVDHVDEDRVRQVGADGVLRKPFEASGFGAVVRPLLQRAVVDRAMSRSDVTQRDLSAAAAGPAYLLGQPMSTLEAERVHAAVTLALDASLDGMIEEITRRVLVALGVTSNPAQPSLFD